MSESGRRACRPEQVDCSWPPRASGSPPPPAEAARVLAAISAPLSAAQSLERSLLDAETALLANRAQEAWQKISAIPSRTRQPMPARPRYYAAQDAHRAGGGAPGGWRARGNGRRALHANAAERTQLRTRLLAALRDARERGVKLEPQSSPDPIVRGWLELGAIATDTRGASLIGEAEAASWRAKYPNHPALEVLPRRCRRRWSWRAPAAASRCCCR
jgi:outer membrane PBP1 activator LpoA protein